ncbi:MAG TPA: sialate O-acetylesterase [Luteolibacter sp.]|nr:sialate O-acetylesterase [Luteolibacter sp.]
MKSTFTPTPFLAIALALTSLSTVRADVVLSKLFSDHMVLQQNQPIRIWGKAEPGEQVTVELAGKSASVKAGADRRWRIDLPPMKADGKALTLTVKGKNTLTLNDVLLGEVWICSGQSNMEWALNAIPNGKEEAAAANHPEIRLYRVSGNIASPAPIEDPRGQWKLCSPTTAAGFSAVAYFFARELHQQLKVPVGLVGTYWGGTFIEPWTPAVGFRAVPELKEISDKLEPEQPAIEAAPPVKRGAKMNGSAPTAIYNGMVHGLTPLSARGVIWYQGESNAKYKGSLPYEYLKEALVKGWRTTFENDKLSFHWVQLANFQNPDKSPAGGGWGVVREGQRRALRLPHTGMAVAIDIGDAGNIHPANKQDVGKRLSLWALAKDYGKDIVCSGPLYKGMKKEGSKIRVEFDYTGSGLMVAQKQGLDPAKETPGAELTQFAIQDAAGKWHWAKAAIDGNGVLVWNDEVKDPTHVRFGYQSNPVGINLYNKEGLPASPFTTD